MEHDAAGKVSFVTAFGLMLHRQQPTEGCLHQDGSNDVSYQPSALLSRLCVPCVGSLSCTCVHRRPLPGLTRNHIGSRQQPGFCWSLIMHSRAPCCWRRRIHVAGLIRPAHFNEYERTHCFLSPLELTWLSIQTQTTTLLLTNQVSLCLRRGNEGPISCLSASTYKSRGTNQLPV